MSRTRQGQWGHAGAWGAGGGQKKNPSGGWSPGTEQDRGFEEFPALGKCWGKPCSTGKPRPGTPRAPQQLWGSCEPSQGAPEGWEWSLIPPGTALGCSQGTAKPEIQETGISPSSSLSQQLLLPFPCPASPGSPRCRDTWLTPAELQHPEPPSQSPGHGPTLPWGCSGVLAQPHSPSTPGRDTPGTCSSPRVCHDPGPRALFSHSPAPALVLPPLLSPRPGRPGCVCLQVICT